MKGKLETMTQTDQTDTTTAPTRKQGAAWKNSRLFDSYEKASEEKEGIAVDNQLEVKIKRRSEGRFVVKSRKNKNVTTKTTE
jgi:hypothetical protein